MFNFKYRQGVTSSLKLCNTESVCSVYSVIQSPYALKPNLTKFSLGVIFCPHQIWLNSLLRPTMLHCYIVTLLQCYIVTLLQCYNVTLLQCYIVTMLHCYNVPTLRLVLDISILFCFLMKTKKKNSQRQHLCKRNILQIQKMKTFKF